MRVGEPMLEYQRAGSELTLEEGLREYYASRADLVQGRGLSPAARNFFRCHDAAHVVFGYDTTLPQEAVVKIWSFFGTTAGLSLLRAYRLPESQEVYEELGWGEIAGTAFRSLVLFPRVLWRCVRMRKRWPWDEFAHHLSERLVDLRRDYGIEPVYASGVRASQTAGAVRR